MISGGLESVLISDPVDSDDSTFIGIRERSLGNGTGLLSDQLLLSALFYFDSILSLVTVGARK